MLAEDGFRITEAKWENGDDKVVVKGKLSVTRSRVDVVILGADGNPVLERTVRAREEWKFNRENLDIVACVAEATELRTGNTDSRDIEGRPSVCDDAPPLQPVEACNISVSPTTLAFGDVTVGQSPTLSTTVSNSGAATCNVDLAPSGSDDFAVTGATSFDVAPGASRSVSVSYGPGAAGGDNATLAVGSNDPDTATVNVSLSGNGVEPQVQECNISVSPLALNFGDVNVGETGTLSTTVDNNGDAACNVTIAPSGSTDFSAAPLSFTLAPAGSQVVTVDYGPGEAGTDNGTLAVSTDDPNNPQSVNVALSGDGLDVIANCNPAAQNLSINSSSQSGCPEQPVPEANQVLNSNIRVLAINDLGMHCGDLDTRISSILPPFQVLLGQVIQRGSTPTLNPADVTLEYSAASNPNDPALALSSQACGTVDKPVPCNGTYKTNFWDVIAGGAYDPFYPSVVTPLLTGPFPVTEDFGLPVPNAEELYIGPDGLVNSGDESLTAVQHAMPGLTNPYVLNAPEAVQEHYGDKPFFVNFPFGYVAADVNWYEGAGIPFAAYDDYGRENAYPLVRVEAKQGNTTVGTVDTVLPISGEASCTNCHSVPADVQNSRTNQPTLTLTNAGLPVATSLDDPDPNLPNDVSVEYAADINILRLHDLKHGANYVDTSGASTPCDITADGGNGDANCLINKALVQGNAVVCQVCHYTPALDLAQVGPVAGPPGTDANGRNQVAHSSNSNVMHSHHGGLGNLFPPMPAPNQLADGTITNQAERLAVLEETCYQCHPGTNVQCLRGAMFNGGMLCNDCHGDMKQVGADFSAGVSPQTPGAFVLGGDFYDPNDPQPRVPWANEPGCGSCHTGDVRDNLVGSVDSIVNTRDVDGNVDNLRLRQAYRTGDAKATPIVPTNKRFAEPAVPASFNGFDNPGAGNPQLYRVSTGHGGVMCEGCHGATHAEWPNANPLSNDNIAADQLQGHVGTIIECGTCHTNINALGTNGSTNSLRGPHGMHAVGETDFADGGHKDSLNRNACRDCHGDNGEGSVLSRTAADRDFRGMKNGGLVPKGTPVTCTMCHGNEL